jgi:hypothetical protein
MYHMKIAKATEQDVNAACRLLGMIEDVAGGSLPRGIDGEVDEGDDPDPFDRENPEHLRMFHDRIMHCASNPPSGLARVIWGFATIMDNNILDPDSKHLDLHPRLKTDDLLKAAKEALEAMSEAQTFESGILGRSDVIDRLFIAIPPLHEAILQMDAAGKKDAQPQHKTAAAPGSQPIWDVPQELRGEAMTHQSRLYPRHWNGQVPTRVRMKITVHPDPWAILNPEEARIVCESGKEYEVSCNSHGAVTAIFQNGTSLGLKPHEFEIVAWVNPGR